MALTTVDQALSRVFDFEDTPENRKLLERLIAIAHDELVRICDREFEYDPARVEHLRPYDGRLYPRLLPIKAVSSLRLVEDNIAYEVDGAQILLTDQGSTTPYPYRRLYGSRPARRYALTYSGGYQEDEIPADLLRILDDLIQYFRVSRDQYAGVSAGGQTGVIRTRIRYHKSGIPSWIYDRIRKGPYRRIIPRAVSYGY